MIFDLTDEDRAALERVRVARGHRSQAETLRALIREAVDGEFVSIGVVRPTKRVVKGVAEPARKPRGFDTKGDPIY